VPQGLSQRALAVLKIEEEVEVETDHAWKQQLEQEARQLQAQAR
jgi:hypothetical protein